MKFFRYLAINTTIVAALATAVFCGAQTENFDRVENPAPVGSPTWVLENNVCDAPVEGVFPTSVILQRMDGDHGSFFTSNPVKVGKALDEELAGKDWFAIRVLRFCK